MKENYEPRKATLAEALIVFAGLVLIMCVSILVFKINPHIHMFIGVIYADKMDMQIGYT